MGATSDPNLIKVTELFLIPSSFLVAALGTADTNLHRAAVSLLGLIVSIMWWGCSREALSEINSNLSESNRPGHPRRMSVLAWLAVVFAWGWLVSLIAHLLLWGYPLGA